MAILSSDPAKIVFYTDSKEVFKAPLRIVQWTIIGTTTVTSLCSEIFVRCLAPCTINTNHASNLTITNMINSIFNCTFASFMILRGLIHSYLHKYYGVEVRQVTTGALVTMCLLILLVTNLRARAHLAGRLRNQLTSMGLEPAWGQHEASMRLEPVAVALVELEGNVSR
jgi:hypothetical protein